MTNDEILRMIDWNNLPIATDEELQVVLDDAKKDVWIYGSCQDGSGYQSIVWLDRVKSEIQARYSGVIRTFTVIGKDIVEVKLGGNRKICDNTVENVQRLLNNGWILI